MKKTKKLILLIVITMFLIMLLAFYYNNYTKIAISDETWSNYDKSIENIKKNMNEITENSDDWIWWKLKPIKLDDANLLNAFNLLIGDIRMCYIYATDNGQRFANANPLKKYKENKYITKKELKNLQFETEENTCLDYFEKYNLIVISNDKELENLFKSEIKEVQSLKKQELYKKENPTYEEMIDKELLKIKKISELTNWLRNQYYVYKEK